MLKLFKFLNLAIKLICKVDPFCGNNGFRTRDKTVSPRGMYSHNLTEITRLINHDTYFIEKQDNNQFYGNTYTYCSKYKEREYQK